jgi:hypothetical protein
LIRNAKAGNFAKAGFMDCPLVMQADNRQKSPLISLDYRRARPALSRHGGYPRGAERKRSMRSTSPDDQPSCSAKCIALCATQIRQTPDGQTTTDGASAAA